MRLSIAIALPWLLGSVWLRALSGKSGKLNVSTQLGYGYITGLIAVTLLMRIMSFLEIRFSFLAISMPVLALIAVGWWLARKTPPYRLRFPDLSSGQRLIFRLLMLLIVFRLLTLGLELTWRPLYPWDAWAQWATKARVWFEFGRIVPFIAPQEWLRAARLVYTDSAAHYPATIPLIQVWMSYALGRWDDALMNLPWVVFSVALGLAFYGQARAFSIHPLYALVFTYLLLSLPLLNVHVALAGYADLLMAVVYGLAVMAFAQWIVTRNVAQGVLALVLALSCPLIKNPGLVWMLTFIPALIVVLLPRRGLWVTAALAVIAGVALFILAQTKPVILGYELHAVYSPVWRPLLQNYFILDNWHLLAYVFVAVILVSLRLLFSSKMRAMTVLLLTGFAFLGVVFFFTMAEAWVSDFTTVNRATLHIVPALVFYLLLLSHEYFTRVKVINLSESGETKIG